MPKELESTYIQEVKRGMSKEMPRILKEISIYENRLAKGELTVNPKISPQFNG